MRLPLVFLILSVGTPLVSFSQQQAVDSARTLRTVTVTATRQATDVRAVPAPVSVLDARTMRERSANSATDLLRELPGVDVVGTGPNQARPSIRGQRGQRILLLQDGLRLNNARRQQDFGELPSFVDIEQLERVEVVRGPSSVLYGSDAIGGVINLITRPPATDGPTVRGGAGYRYSGAGDQQRGDASVNAIAGPFAFSASGHLRNAGDYLAPAGTFGGVRLGSTTRLDDSGVRDRGLALTAAWHGTTGRRAWMRHDTYEARNAGFGLVEPRVLGDTSTRVQLTYPWQDVAKTSAGVALNALGAPFADRLDVSAYTQRNVRDFHSLVDVYVPTGPGRTATINSRSFNATDVRTNGLRAELARVTRRAVFTYGVDFFRDDARSADSSWSRTVGFGPAPIIQSGTTPSLANAVLRNLGIFAQGDWRLHDRVSVITGVRFHDVSSETRPTVGLPDSLSNLDARNRTTVYAINGIYRLTDRVSLISAVGRGFRAPNLIERYFAGPSTDGTALQVTNADLVPETSNNVDVGIRMSLPRVEVEVFHFRNQIRDGIIVRPTGRTFGRLAEFRNVNVARLRTRGVEGSMTANLGRGLGLALNYTDLDTRDPDTPDVPVAGTYSTKLNAAMSYRPRSGAFWAEYAVRHQGRQQDINLGTSPIGAVLPAFTVSNVRAGLRLGAVAGRPQDLTLAIVNLTNRLYAEAANSAFFRPEAARHIIVGLRSTF
ncbi:MAG: TonB-dependent receptor [Gemmatimonadetes bacterium]|nr:TonB-dependent receptor [Gemmatimonadota bacterium]